MYHAQRLTAEKLGKRLALIQPKVLRAHHPIKPFKFDTISAPDTPIDLDFIYDRAPGQLLEWDSYWAQQDTHFVLQTEFVIPDSYAHPVLHLPLGNAGDIFTHPEALLYINGKLIASADRYHHQIALGGELARNVPHRLVLKGWTGLTGWPIDPNNKNRLFMRQCSVAELDPTLRDFVALADVALDVANTLPDQSAEHHGLLTALDRAFVSLDTRDPMGESLYESASAALDELRTGIERAGRPLDVTLHGIGHAHMDVAYLWPVAQIRQKNARTYSNVLRLMDDHPDYTFSHSQPLLYQWTDQDFPDLFNDIKKRIDEGRWEVLRGMWVEPDANMPGGESLVRQMQLARRYCEQDLGTQGTPVLWLPDTFGFPASLPQLMKLAGLEWFATNKPNWNQYNEMPSSSFWWEGLDGTRVLTQLLTTPRDVQHLPFPTNYKSDLSAAEVIGTWERNTAKHAVKDLLIAYGYGDGGGGPTDDLIRRAQAYKTMPGAPVIKPSTVKGFFEQLEQNTENLPTWRGEIYIEGHRGVLTSQGWIKKANRDAEGHLHLAEYCAALVGNSTAELQRAWEVLCLNQFHDILTGTSVPAVFDDARADFERVAKITQRSIDDSIAKLAQGLPKDHYLMVDSCPLVTDRLIALDAITDDVCIRDVASGNVLPSQNVQGGTLVAIPPVSGYQQTLLAAEKGMAPAPDQSVNAFELDHGYILQNAYLTVEFGKDGGLVRIKDRIRDRDVLADGCQGNRLLAHEDRPISWDAWDIDAFIDDRVEEVAGPVSVRIEETGPLLASLVVEKQWRDSTITQRIVLTHASRRIDFETDIDWHESHTLLTAEFPVAIRADFATFDIQFGQVTRPTHANTSWDFAKFEVAAQKWADLSEADYGVALLNNGRYGYSVRENRLRLSLIKSATSPDPNSDQGKHRFTYSLLPHEGDWRNDVPAQAYALNTPYLCVSGKGDDASTTTDPIVESLQDHVIIETIKPAEDGNGVIVRLYESQRKRGKVQLKIHQRFVSAEICSLLEDETINRLPLHDQSVELDIKPYEIVTLRLT